MKPMCKEQSKRYAAQTLLCATALLATSQSNAAVVKQFAATTAESAPLIDGDTSESVWNTAQVIDNFHEVEPTEFAPSKERIRVRVLYDADFLYVAADIEMRDNSEITAFQLAQGTNLFSDDRFSVILDPYNNQRSGYEFRLNPNGVRDEGIFDGPGRLNSNWSGIWNGMARITDSGWSAEFAIPFKSLNFNANNADWGISFALKIFSRDETIAWTSQNRDVRPGTLGEITGMTEAQQGQGLDVKTALSLVESRDFEMGVSEFKSEPSVDIFYKLTPSLTTALTINTDFSATEVDDRIVNLERFSVFFPEKRSFFLQDADIFSFGGLNRNGIPFFSRRMGLDENHQPVDIVVGAKLTGRTGPLNVGVLNVVQDSFLDEVNLFVGRASMNVLSDSTVGFILTDGSPVDGESNTVVGTDFNYLNRDLFESKTLRGNVWYQRSDTNGVSGDQEAWGIGVEVPQSAGLDGGIRFKKIGDRFYPALGFVNRPGIREYSAEIAYRYYPESGPWFFYNPSLEFEHVENISGEVESQAWKFEPFFVANHSVDWFRLTFEWQREVLLESFEIRDGVFIQTGDYSWNKSSAYVSSGEQRVVYATITVTDGDFYDGERFDIEGFVTWQPSKHFSARAGFSHNDIELTGGSFVSRLMTLRTTVGISSTMSWITLAQYDNDSDELGLNTRLRWVPQSGREFILVLNHGFLVNEHNPVPTRHVFRSLESDMVLKGSYTFRF